MSMHWTEDQLREVMSRKDRRNIPQERKTEIATLGGQARANKYRNVITVVDGIRFDSKKEAQHYQQLMLMKAGGAIKGFARQVSLPLPSGKRRLRLDFVVHELDGRIRWLDVKGGKPTDTWLTKRDEAEAMLGIKIETV